MSLDASSVSGKTAAQALEVITAAIVGNNEKLLMSIGIQADFDAGYRKLAESLNKGVYALTEQEKQQARVNSTQEAAKSILGSYENYLDDAKIASNELSRALDSLRIELSETFSVDTSSLIYGMAEAIDWITARVINLRNAFSGIGAVIRGELDLSHLASMNSQQLNLSLIHISEPTRH